MAMSILNNSSTALSLGELNKNISKLGEALAKISTGQRIVGAKDDSASFAISEIMREQIRSLEQDIQNVQNGSSILKIAHGGIENIVDELRSLKELAINAANDSNTDADRAIIQKEFDKRRETIDDIATWTTYNGKILLDGTYRRPSYSENVDIVFVVDTTGSMGSFISGVADNLKVFTDSLKKQGKDWRLGLVQYGDIQIGERTLKTHFKSGEFTSDAEEFISVLRSPHMYGGGDLPESGYDAIMDEVSGVMSYNFRSDSMKHVVVLSDASVHDAEDSYARGAYSAKNVIDALNNKNITLSAVIRPPTDYAGDDDDGGDYDDDGAEWSDSDHTDWTRITTATDGVWYSITSNYGSSLAKYAESVTSITKKEWHSSDNTFGNQSKSSN